MALERLGVVLFLLLLSLLVVFVQNRLLNVLEGSLVCGKSRLVLLLHFVHVP